MLKPVVLTASAVAALALTACSSSGGGVVASSSATGSSTASGSSGASSSGASSSGSQGPVTVGLSYIPNVQFSPFYLAVDDGDFSKAGLKPTLRHHGAQESLFGALTSGTEDYLIAGGDEMLQAREQGMPLVAVAPYFRSYPVVLITRSDSGIAAVKDLKGKTIGVPGKYGESWFGLLAALKGAGLTEKDVTVKEIGYTQQAALTTKKVDVVTGYSNNDLVQLRLAGQDVREVTLAKPLPLVSISLVTTEKKIASDPQQVKAVVAAMNAGISTAVQDQPAAIAATQKQVPGLSNEQQKKAAEATLKATVNLWTQGSPTLQPAAFEEMATFMKGSGLLKSDVEVSKAVNTSFTG